ncbi:MAG: HEAT repeat domain-containing protein [Gemmataceae bacterium]
MNRHLVVTACLVVLSVSILQARTLVFLGKSVETWRKELSNRQPAVRRSAAFALGRMGADAREAVSDLVRRLRDDDDKVRDMAASALGDIARALKGNNEEVWTKSGGTLAQLLKDDTSERVRRSAAYALGAFGPQAAGAGEFLMKALGDDKASVRQNAAWALGQIGELAGGAVARLCECLNDKDTLVRRDAAGALGAMGKAGKKAGRPLIAMLKSETDNVVKKTALDSLAYLVGPEQADAAKDLEPLLKAEDPEVRLNAAFVLARIGGDAAAQGLPVLREALKNGEPNIQELVAAALVNLGPNAKPAMHDLADMLTNEKNSVRLRRNSALAIAHIGAEAKPVVPALVKALKSNQPLEVRLFTAEALAQMGYPANKAALADMLHAIENETDPDTRQKCVWALFGMEEPEFKGSAAEKLLTKVLDESGEKMALVRYDAARKLANALRDEAPDKTADVLLEMYRNTSLKEYKGTEAKVTGVGTEASSGKASVDASHGGSARYMAVKAMGWLGEKAKKRADVMAVIRAGAKDADPKMRETAENALQELGVK